MGFIKTDSAGTCSVISFHKKQRRSTYRIIHFIRKLSGTLILSGSVFCLFYVTDARADLDDETSSDFSGMMTVTAPDSYKTQRRGVISGGSLNIRNGIENPGLVAVSSPGISAGCRGIDLYGGSFSYINREEFIRFLRAIAANAEGYAFEIALSSMCEKCAQHIETLQRKVQALNQYFGNSCQLAQGIVNDSLSAFNRKGLNDISLIGQYEGIGDLYEMSTRTDTDAILDSLRDSVPEKIKEAEITGNLLWNLFEQSPTLSGDRELAEAVMSITGTVIVSENGREVRIASGLRISMKDLIAGGTVPMYGCADYGNGCIVLNNRTRKIRGFGGLIRDMFLGADGSPGIVRRYSGNSGSFTVKETEFLNTLPEGTGAMIRNLCARNENAAVMFVEKTANILALLYTRNLLEKYLNQISALARSSNSGYAPILNRQIQEVRSSVSSETTYLSSVFGGLDDLSRIYLDYMELLPEKDYVPEHSLDAFD